MNDEVLHSFKSQDGSEELLCFHCKPCGYSHPFRIKGEGPVWSWNGDMVRPTFDPSLLVNGSVMTEKRCHLNMTKGMIIYHGDCWHELKGTTVPASKWRD